MKGGRDAKGAEPLFAAIDRGIAMREKLRELAGAILGLDQEVDDLCRRLARTSGSGDKRVGRRYRRIDPASRTDRQWLLARLVRSVARRENLKTERLRVRGLVRNHRTAMHEELHYALGPMLERGPEPEGAV